MNTILAISVQFWLFFWSNWTLYDPSDSEFGNFKKCFCSVPLNKLKKCLILASNLHGMVLAILDQFWYFFGPDWPIFDLEEQNLEISWKNCVQGSWQSEKVALFWLLDPRTQFWPFLVQFWLFFGSNLTFYDPSRSKFGNFKKYFCSAPLTKLKKCLIMASNQHDMVLVILAQFWPFFGPNWPIFDHEEQNLEIL